MGGVLVDNYNQVTCRKVPYISLPLPSFCEGWDIFSEPAFPKVVGHYLGMPPSLPAAHVTVRDNIHWEIVACAAN